jgi:restriction endonuclease FokI
MITEHIKKKITTIWDNYILANDPIVDTKGNVLEAIDEKRIEAIVAIKQIINDYYIGAADILQFKTRLDSYNKRNNLWGFTAAKGQMFFNHLTRSSEQNIERLSTLLKEVMREPVDLKDALSKIDLLEKYCDAIFSKAQDKRKVPNPGSVGYFLSYFWQIHNYQKWPILYSSIIAAFEEIGLWNEPRSQRDAYELFYNLNEDVKDILKQHTGKVTISNWDAEHAFWNFKKISGPTTRNERIKRETIEQTGVTVEQIEETSSIIEPDFDISDYLIPRVARLVELGNGKDKSAAAKGSEFERMVADIFRLLDFEVDFHGQGSGRAPDAIIKFREENTAFIVDAKAYSNGYTLGTDDRAIKEYINHHIPKLQKDGYKKIGFIIVSNSFRSEFEDLINDITWNTDIKRFILLTSDALLHLLAYKTKDRISLGAIIESLISLGSLVTTKNVIEKFGNY